MYLSKKYCIIPLTYENIKMAQVCAQNESERPSSAHLKIHSWPMINKFVLHTDKKDEKV